MNRTTQAKVARLFLALELPDALGEQLLKLQTALPADCRLVPKANLHLTLVFIGAADLARVRSLIPPVDQPSFEVKLDGLGAFEQRKETVFWAGVQPSTQLSGLHAQLLDSLQQSGLTPDKQDFRPHITLGRCPNCADSDAYQRFLGQKLPEHVSSFSANYFSLYASEPGLQGPVYRVEARYGLRASS